MAEGYMIIIKSHNTRICLFESSQFLDFDADKTTI